MLGSSSLASAALASVYVSGGQVVVVVPPVTVDKARPSADMSNDGWTPSAGSELFAMINDVVRDDSNYISADRIGATCRQRLPNMTRPGNLLKYSGWSPVGNSVLVKLYTGETIIAQWSHVLALVPTAYERQLSVAQAEQLALGDLSLSFTLA